MFDLERLRTHCCTPAAKTGFRAITVTRAQTEVGFIFFEVYSSTLMINARYVEKALQKRYQHLPLGLRLWRHPDKGKKYDKEVDGKLHKVFITCLLAARRPDARRPQDQGQLLSMRFERERSLWTELSSAQSRRMVAMPAQRSAV